MIVSTDPDGNKVKRGIDRNKIRIDVNENKLIICSEIIQLTRRNLK